MSLVLEPLTVKPLTIKPLTINPKLKKPIVINLFGGPGAGKSRTRARVYSDLKFKNFNCEEAPEWIKGKVYEKNEYVKLDQLYVFAKQRKMIKEIGSQQDIIITDSPLLLSNIYGEVDELFNQLVLREFNSFCNINFVIKRVNPYNPKGRYQTEDEAKVLDSVIEGYLIERNIPYTSIDGSIEAGSIIADRVSNSVMFPQ